MPIPLLGLSLGDLGVAGATAYNAKAAGEAEAQRVRQEEVERQRVRRREALQAALTEVQTEGGRLNNERGREGNARIAQGLAPVPAQESTRTHTFTSTGATDFDTHMQRLGEIGDLEVDIAGRRSGATAAAAAPHRAGARTDPNAPPTTTEKQRLSDMLVESYFARVPNASVDEVIEGVPELIASMTNDDARSAMQLAWDGGAINEVTLAQSWNRRRSSDAQRNEQLGSFHQRIDAACQAGASASEIRENLMMNPDAAPFLTGPGGTPGPLAVYIQQNCGG